MRSLALLLLLAPMACDEIKEDTGVDTAEGDTDTDGDTDADGDGDTDSDSAPTVEEADAYCLYNDSSTQYYYWIVTCSADDPQGADTLAAFGDEWEHLVTVYGEGGGEVASYPLICDGDGDCTGTFEEGDDSVICTSATSYTFSFVVYDQDGNGSEAFEVVGREG